MKHSMHVSIFTFIVLVGLVLSACAPIVPVFTVVDPPTQAPARYAAWISRRRRSTGADSIHDHARGF